VKLLAEHDALVAAHADNAQIEKAKSAIDRAAGQRDAHVARLYWYTDLEEAKTVAKASGKPILSLRLLGRLDEELSCANSRLFRLALYANTKLSQKLRDDYVLHWSSERPAPRIKLDFGDGRVVERTITGNSVHYVLDGQGRIVDALPGLYGPAAFERILGETYSLAKESTNLADEEQMKAIAKHHQKAVWTLTASWRRKLGGVYTETYSDYVKDASLPTPAKWSGNLMFDSLPASVVNNLTANKADMEAPSLATLQPELHASADMGDWAKIAAKTPVEKLDDASRALIAAKHPRSFKTLDANALDETSLAKRLAAFEKRMTEEEVRNEYAFHGAIHTRLAKAANVSYASLNEYVYAKLFLTPQSDAWLGLVPTEVLTGIAEDGIVTPERSR